MSTKVYFKTLQVQCFSRICSSLRVFGKTTRSQFKPFRIVGASQSDQSIDVFVVATSESLCWSLLPSYLLFRQLDKMLQHSFRVLKICSPQFYWFQFFKISRKSWRFTTHPLLAPLSVVYPLRGELFGWLL